MKVLWIVNSILNKLSIYLFGKENQCAWMDAMLCDFQDKKDYRIVVATTTRIKEKVCIEDGNIKYYALPNEYPLLYNENDKSNIAEWKRLLDEEKPDLIQVWGTEFTHGLCALRLANGIPSVIYIQGYVGSIARHYFAGMTHDELKKNVTFRDIIRRDSITAQQKKFAASTEKEKEMLSLADGYIYEGEWCKSSLSAIVPKAKAYYCPLSINRIFEGEHWDMQNVEPHSVICTASGYPLKGLHMMLRAIALLKKDYPDVKLYVPGTRMVCDGSLSGKIRRSGYMLFIEKLIAELDIRDNVVWMGMVPQSELAKQYAKTRVFVLSSSIENHSSSLIEAMIVGVPSIATYVGGVPEYIRHGENGFLYRFEEYEIMAGYVKRIFDDDALAASLSDNGYSDMRARHENMNIYGIVTAIYDDLLSKKQ